MTNDGNQVYWVCTLIYEPEVLECKVAEDTDAELSLALTKLKINLVQVRMKYAESSR